MCEGTVLSMSNVKEFTDKSVLKVILVKHWERERVRVCVSKSD